MHRRLGEEIAGVDVCFILNLVALEHLGHSHHLYARLCPALMRGRRYAVAGTVQADAEQEAVAGKMPGQFVVDQVDAGLKPFCQHAACPSVLLLEPEQLLEALHSRESRFSPCQPNANAVYSVAT